MAISKTLKMELEEIDNKYSLMNIIGRKAKRKPAVVNEPMKHIRFDIIKHFFVEKLCRYVLPLFAVGVSASDNMHESMPERPYGHGAYVQEFCLTQDESEDVERNENTHRTHGIYNYNTITGNTVTGSTVAESIDLTNTDITNNIDDNIDYYIHADEIYRSLHQKIEREFYNFSLLFDQENNIINSGNFNERIDYILENFCSYLQDNNSQLLDAKLLIRLYLAEQYGNITLQDIERDGTMENWCIGACER